MRPAPKPPPPTVPPADNLDELRDGGIVAEEPMLPIVADCFNATSKSIKAAVARTMGILLSLENDEEPAEDDEAHEELIRLLL